VVRVLAVLMLLLSTQPPPEGSVKCGICYEYFKPEEMVQLPCLKEYASLLVALA
jgi:hypothetical protein